MIKAWRKTVADMFPGINSTWRTQAQQTLDAGKKLGLYHFVKAGINGATQADYFLNQVSGFVGKAILVLDFENELDKYGHVISNVRNTAGLTMLKLFLIGYTIRQACDH